jgi:hypothetical protein
MSGLDDNVIGFDNVSNANVVTPTASGVHDPPLVADRIAPVDDATKTKFHPTICAAPL